MYYSYVMGIGEAIMDLKKHNFIINKDGNNYTVSFSKEKKNIWEEFVEKHLERGYWNEYLSESEIIFLFQLEDGIKRYEVLNFNNEEVLALCEKLCECKFGSIKEMILGNGFYRRVLRK